MLRILCFRPKPSFVLSHSHHRLISSTRPPSPLLVSSHPRLHSSACYLGASIWPVRKPHGGACGEGSWNVAWDVRPARWIHRVDSAWLLFGVCACLAATIGGADVEQQLSPPAIGNDSQDIVRLGSENGFVNYRVIGVKADGRCLFRAIAHVACVRNGEAAPDENRQRELADDLRAQVVDELQKRRKETEWFIDEDFDAYVNRIRQPYVWGGEPELMIASHILKTPISVFMVNKKSGSLMKIADYGEEYQKENENPITIQFHGYGHYDILEAVSDQKDSRAVV